jgi:hypothetical protein
MEQHICSYQYKTTAFCSSLNATWKFFDAFQKYPACLRICPSHNKKSQPDKGLASDSRRDGAGGSKT